MTRTRSVAIVSLLFTIVFFLEYTPLYKRVHIPYDLEGFHYPLADYMFRALRAGRFPQWDPVIYSGISFVGNVQAAMFYPPAWLMIAMSWRHDHLPYQALEDLSLAHVWVAFTLCYAWLHGRRKLHWLASILGAGVFAFSGHMLLQLQHLGLICGYAWIPLGFSGIDQACEERRWQPLWKLAVASAMCLLAGYPPTWVVFAICMAVYAAARKNPAKPVAWVTCALAASMCVAAVQLLPGVEASQMKVPDVKYKSASGVKEPEFFISYFAPNYFDFGLDVPIYTNVGKEYLYLGAAGIVGLALLFVRRRFADLVPFIAVLVVSLLFLVNPFGLIGALLERSLFLSQIFSSWYFLAGITAALAPLAAIGIDYGLTRRWNHLPAHLPAITIYAALGWSFCLFVYWTPGDAGFASGWKSGIDALIAIVICLGLIAAYRSSSASLRRGVVAALIVLVAIEYKAFGTSKRFNAVAGRSVPYDNVSFRGMNQKTYAAMLRAPGYRLALDGTGPAATDLRHKDLSTPQGFDPLLPEQYAHLIDQVGHFYSNRMFDLNPENAAALRLLGVRYFVTSDHGPAFSKLYQNSDFRLMQPDDSYYKIFEMQAPQPSFGWEDPSPDRTAEMKMWTPEKRTVSVRSPNGGTLRLSEQFYPGWTATVDRNEAVISRCHEAFQCISVPAGDHLVEFQYRSRWLGLGAALSLASITALVIVARSENKREKSQILA